MTSAVRTSFLATVLAGLTVAGATSDAAGQAICSAPHSAPSLSRAGIGTLVPGTGWIQIGAYHSRSAEFFGPDGVTRPFIADGVARATSVFLTAAAGVVDGVEVWVQVPVHRLEFSDAAGDLNRIGVGDPRIAVRIGAELLGLHDVPLSIRTGLKLPGSAFPVDPDLLPLSEGQTDLELALEGGTVLRSTAVHLVGWVGYRWRGRDAVRSRKPGNEWFGQLGVGGPLGRFQWELGLEGLRGQSLEQQGLLLPGARRRLVQIVPAIGYVAGRSQIELSARLNAYGRNLPSGPAFTASVLVPWAF